MELHYQRTVNPADEILITAGATQAIFSIIQAIVRRDEEVIILDPSYDCYAPAVDMVEGKPVHVNMNADFSVNWNTIEEAINANTRLLIINSPHNPSGQVFTEDDILAIEDIMERHPQLFLLSDEVYEYIYFLPKKHISIHSRPKLRNRALVVSSFGKTFHVTGWKMGYVVAPSYLLDEVKKAHQFIVFCVNSTAQQALAKFLPQTNLDELGVFYKEKRDFFRSQMEGSRFELLPCDGTYFQTAKYSEISDKSDVEFVKELIQKHGVAATHI